MKYHFQPTSIDDDGDYTAAVVIEIDDAMHQKLVWVAEQYDLSLEEMLISVLDRFAADATSSQEPPINWREIN